MRYGFSLPVRGSLADQSGIANIAQHDERLGFSSAAIADHIVFPTAVRSKQPATQAVITQASATRSSGSV
jgi:alkanesulfonate monooxygenase SsuD/methylene tetrahydromethanopterin reductase-like flavin-dependent oxidoreductase (luciferase family)